MVLEHCHGCRDRGDRVWRAWHSDYWRADAILFVPIRRVLRFLIRHRLIELAGHPGRSGSG